MNARAEVDQFEVWREALRTGKPVAYERGAPTAGYFKRAARNDDRSKRWDAVAIWQDDDGEWCCVVSAGYAPRHADEIEELFVSCNSTPISFELFQAVYGEGKPWPEDVAPVEVAPELEPHAQADAELSAQREALAAWIKEIGKVATQEQADKAAAFADIFARIEKDSDAARKTEKKPFDEGAAAVQAKWQPVVNRAGELKTYAKKAIEPYLIAERARIAAEKKAQDDATAKAAREVEDARRAAAAANEPPPVAPVEPPAPPPPVRKASAGRIHIRKETTHEIVDFRAVLGFFADMNNPPPDLIATVQTLVNRMRAAGVEVPGVETKTAERAA